MKYQEVIKVKNYKRMNFERYLFYMVSMSTTVNILMLKTLTF